MNAIPGYRTFARAALYASLAVVWAMAARAAHADMLVSETTLVSGTDSSVASFTVTSAEPITVQLSNIAWPQMLSSLTFMLSSADQVIGSWSSTDTSTVETYQLSAGTYFAHITGTATGSVDLGLYSLSIGTQPAPVPLPAGGALLVGGLAVLMMLGWLLRSGVFGARASVTSG